MADFGGVIRFSVDGVPFKMRGTFTVEPMGFTYAAEHNQDGSFDRTMSPQGPSAKFTLVDSADGDSAVGQDWDAITRGARRLVRIVEDSAGVIHTFRAAAFIGRAEVDRLKGDVTGLTIQAPVGGYIKTTA